MSCCTGLPGLPQGKDDIMTTHGPTQAVKGPHGRFENALAVKPHNAHIGGNDTCRNFHQRRPAAAIQSKHHSNFPRRGAQ